MSSRRPIRDRFWEKALADGTGCWLWQGALTAKGYGKFWVDDTHRSERVHRVAYELVKGPIPDGETVDHLCRVRHCVNPGHLEAVSNRENVLRGEGPTAINARKTHCPRGHVYDEKNTYRWHGGRYCRTCLAARLSDYRQGHPVAAEAVA